VTASIFEELEINRLTKTLMYPHSISCLIGMLLLAILFAISVQVMVTLKLFIANFKTFSYQFKGATVDLTDWSYKYNDNLQTNYSMRVAKIKGEYYMNFTSYLLIDLNTVIVTTYNFFFFRNSNLIQLLD
jgi:hypothetical protein